MTSVNYGYNQPQPPRPATPFGGMPDPYTFANPWGGNTSTDYSGPAVTAWGNVAGKMADAYGNMGAARYGAWGGAEAARQNAWGQAESARYGAEATRDASRYNALAGLGQGFTGNYNAYAQGMGQMGSNIASQYGTYGQTLGGLGNAAAGGYGAMAGALGNMRDSDATAFGNYGAALAGGLGAYGNAMSNLGGASANAYGSYAGGLGSMSQAMANERGALANANAIAESARQGSLGNVGAAALGAYGSAANSALAAWAQNQSSYNKALSDMNVANQSATAQYGGSRNAALGQAAGAYSQTAAGSAPAAAATNIAANFGMDGGGVGGGTGFSADVGGENFATGSFGGGDGSLLGGLSGNISRSTDPAAVQGIASSAFGGVDATRGDIMDNRVLDALTDGSMRDANRLDMQHLTSRNTPFSALGGILGGIRGLGSDAYGESRAGMDQFYSNAPATDYESILAGLQEGLAGARSQIGGMSNQMSAGYQGMRDDMAGAYGNYDAGDTYGALMGGYGGLQDTLGGLGRSAGMGYGSATGSQLGLAGGIGQGFGEANNAIGGLLNALPPNERLAMGEQPAIGALPDDFSPFGFAASSPDPMDQHRQNVLNAIINQRSRGFNPPRHLVDLYRSLGGNEQVGVNY